MKFGHLISEAGFDINNFTKLADIPVEIYDRKNRKIENELHFVKPILSDNLDSQTNFKKFLENMGKISILPSSILVRLTEDILVIYISGSKPEFFLRF